MLIPGDRLKTGLLSKYTPMQLQAQVEFWRKIEVSMQNEQQR